MKILQLSKYYPPAHGGIELVAEFFSRAAVGLNHQVSVISLGSENKSYVGRYGEKVEQCFENIKFSSSPLSRHYYQTFRTMLNKESPDVIFVHLPHPFAHELCKWFRPLLKEKKIRVIGIYHSDIINQVLLRDAYNLHFCRHLDVYDSFICASPNLKVSSSILSKLSPDKVTVIPFCVDHDYQDRPLRASIFAGKFITIGRMVPYKGYEFLINTFNSLPYTLTFVGGGPLLEDLKKIAGSNISFSGEITEAEKFDLLASHDALIMSSLNRAEAYGMTIVEAFSVGLPVIASDIDTGVSFLVRNGETGLKFPIKDKDALVTAIERFKNDPALAEKLSRNCLSFFQRELNFTAFRNNLNRMLSSL